MLKTNQLPAGAQGEVQQRHGQRDGPGGQQHATVAAAAQNGVAQQSAQDHARHAGQAVDGHRDPAGACTSSRARGSRSGARNPPMAYMLKLCSAPEAMIQRMVGIESTRR